MQNRFSRRTRAAAALATGVLALSAVPATAAPPDNDHRPVPADQSFEAGAGELCAFPVRFDITGKAKVIGNLLEDHKTTSPAFKATITNLASGESVKYTITGVSRYTVAVDDNGEEYFEVVSTGQNILSSVELGGFFFVRGTVDYAVTLDLPIDQREVRPFVPTVDDLGEVNAVNICDALS
jgi:hypothetical protein